MTAVTCISCIPCFPRVSYVSQYRGSRVRCERPARGHGLVLEPTSIVCGCGMERPHQLSYLDSFRAAAADVQSQASRCVYLRAAAVDAQHM